VAEGAEEAGRDPATIRRMIEIKVSYDRDAEAAVTNTYPWAALALKPDQKSGIEDPIEMERVADANAERAPSRFIVSDDPEEVVDRIGAYLDLGFEDLLLHAPGDDQRRFLEQLGDDVLPRLRERAAAPGQAPSSSGVGA
jgi:coenzyme F420-dependent glucose-6-phosphate dehydrogenase